MKLQKTLIALALLISSLRLFAQDAGTNAVTPPPPVPEEARKHFVMGAALFKDARTPDDYTQVVGEFKQATDLAPQWPEARYNQALAREAAGDYSGAMTDLKLYQQFKLSDTEARTVQDKIYTLEAKAGEAAKKKGSVATTQSDQQIMDLQGNFPGLIHRLQGETFDMGGDGGMLHPKGTFCFLKKPFDASGKSYNATSYLWQQDTFDEGSLGSHMTPAAIVIPTSNDTFFLTNPDDPTDMSDKTLEKSHCKEDVWTLSKDGNTLTENAPDGTPRYYTKK